MMKLLDLMIDLSHYVAVAGAYATVVEMLFNYTTLLIFSLGIFRKPTFTDSFGLLF